MTSRFAANSTFARSIDTIGWALFFMWVGIAMLASVGWTIALAGTAVIILSVQILLFLRGHRIDIFMSSIGLVLLVGTVTDTYGLPLSLVPALLILIGVLMLADAFRSGSGETADQR